MLAQQQQKTERLGIANIEAPQKTTQIPWASHIVTFNSSCYTEPQNTAEQLTTFWQKTGFYPSYCGKVTKWSLKGPSNSYEVSYYSMCKMGWAK